MTIATSTKPQEELVIIITRMFLAPLELAFQAFNDPKRDQSATGIVQELEARHGIATAGICIYRSPSARPGTAELLGFSKGRGMSQKSRMIHGVHHYAEERVRNTQSPRARLRWPAHLA